MMDPHIKERVSPKRETAAQHSALKPNLVCRMSGNIRAVSVVRVVLVCLVICRTLTRTVAAPLCTNGQAGCHALSLANLFDRVIQHSARMHGISNDLHSEFEHYFLPSKNQIGRVGRNCHTSSVLTPNVKENAQRMAREDLTKVILKLLVAWRDPLWHFHQRAAHHSDFTDFSTNKALDMSDMVPELLNGVEKLVEKMQLLGVINDPIIDQASSEAPLPPGGTKWHLMKGYDLLYCFRRDSNKVQNYLKILKCRIVPEYGC